MPIISAVLSKAEITHEKKDVLKDLIVLRPSLSALVCAALNLHSSLNMLGNKEEE